MKKDINEVARRIVERLADVGIHTAQASLGSLNDIGNVSGLIVFTKEIEQTDKGYKAIMIARDSQKVVSTWRTKEGTKSAIVSPLLMSEFGSGNNADISHMDIFEEPVKAGQGTFPNQTHAFDKWWSWQSLDGKWHSSKGIKPTMPMYNAWLEMVDQVDNIIAEEMK